MAADEVLALAAPVQKVVDLVGVAVEDRDREAVAFHVEHEVFAHHREADEPDVRFAGHCFVSFMLDRCFRCSLLDLVRSGGADVSRLVRRRRDGSEPDRHVAGAVFEPHRDPDRGGVFERHAAPRRVFTHHRKRDLEVLPLVGVNSVAYQSTMLNNLKVFADKDNYPIAFHCAIGRDRTGTLAITLYLLLGIDVEQIQQDYIVSFFSSACNRDSFENCGEQMETLIYYFSSYKGKDGVSSGTIYERTAEYATDIGLSTDELNRIRNNLLENC